MLKQQDRAIFTKTFQSQETGEILVQSFLDLEVDLVVLSRELLQLENFSLRIAKRLRESRQSLLEQDSRRMEC